MSVIFMVIAGSPDLSQSLVEYLRSHPNRDPSAGTTIGLVLNFVAIESAEMTDAVLEALTEEIARLPTTGDSET